MFRLRTRSRAEGGWLSGTVLTMVSDDCHKLPCSRPAQRTCSVMPVAPTVGVVVANHNNAAFVERAIDSVARQTVRDLSVVVVDDASTDRSDEAIRRCLARLDDARFRYV